jgi:hypothetical protein
MMVIASDSRLLRFCGRGFLDKALADEELARLELLTAAPFMLP